MREKERECRVKAGFDRLWEGWFVRKEAMLLCARIEPQSQEEEEEESLSTSAQIIFFFFYIIFLFEIVI